MTAQPLPVLERVAVDDVGVGYRRFGPKEADRIVLIHGGAAHSGWWSRVAPVLARDHHVVTLDLSGHGESDHRPDYRAELWAADVASVVRDVGAARTGRMPALVGHSMGGLVAVATAARFPELVDRMVLIDTRLPLHELPPPTAPARLYPSAQQALDRFRLLPERTNADAALLQEVAKAGLLETEAGWRWRFDPAALRRFRNAGVLVDLSAVRCPVGYLYGERSDMGGRGSADYLSEGLGCVVPVDVVPNAFHHVPLDQPGPCAAAIVSMLLRLAER